MDAASKYLENLQGMLLFLSIKRNYSSTLSELCRLSPEAFEILEQDFREAYEELLMEHQRREYNSLLFLEKLKLEYDKNEKEYYGREDDATANQTIKEALKNPLPPNTAFQDQTTYLLITDLAKSIEEAIDELAIKRPNVTFGTLHTKSFNACAIYLKEYGQHLILFETQLFFFLNRITKIIVRCLVLKEFKNERHNFSILAEEMIEKIDNNADIQGDFNELLLTFISDGNITALPILILPPELTIIHSILLNAMESFIMGHEYGHILKRHAQQSSIIPWFIRDDTVNISKPNWQQEFEADEIGIVLSTLVQYKSMKTTDFSLVGASLFFSITAIMEEAFYVDRIYGNNSHPPSRQRRERVFEILNKEFSNEQMLNAEMLPNSIHQVIQYLWGKCKPIVSGLHYKS